MDDLLNFISPTFKHLDLQLKMDEWPACIIQFFQWLDLKPTLSYIRHLALERRVMYVVEQAVEHEML